MRRITEHAQFRRDLRRQRRRGKDIEELILAVELLAETGLLPEGYNSHPLSGEWKSVLECHIEPDWLLIYEVTPDEVLLIRIGTHRDLFG
ncbi:MAG TPA: type II toxin-antitoxin system YafQ family toxin [Stellaceae bacterium]|nr:type II toxin-antitoxin system YafQ family toxin [Stellaceae bacterium]